MKKIFLILTSAVFLLTACHSFPDHPSRKNQLPPIYPDYAGVTIPVDIAPLDFNYCGGRFECMDVVVKGSKGGELHSNGSVAEFDVKDWHHLTEENKGGKLLFTVCIENKGKWVQYRSFEMKVSPYALDEYGLTYRKIAPGYEVYSKMGIYQRDLSNYDESAILENTDVPGACMNCHTSNRTDPHEFTFHIRGSHGATLIDINGRMEWLKAKNDSLHGSLVYPYWHPSGKYCAYSTNKTHQSFHAVRNERIEVFDQASDVLVYEPETHQLLLDSLLMTPDHFETYPAFSPDGKTLYFCSSQAEPIPEGYQKVRYNLCKISFNPSDGTFGNRVDTIVNARKMGKSLTFPRPSYDGKYIMFTFSDYGCFPIWHKEADLGLLDLRTGKVRMLNEVNSNQTESFHNWNINSHWFVFSSRRGNGLYTRLYLASIDAQGHVSKPFLLPQKNPGKYYGESVYSYNIPDFTKTKINFDFRKAGREIMSDRRVNTIVR
ncbi:MAG: hypothetical protein LKK21_07055 [Prevotella sp.]|jgi:hypothetical protein|nr:MULTISPECIES: hypothetical protein [unclassified Prevotella]MCH3985246.1 hypothetical protein [Prevotella sp.]MCI1372263.1 hypothetical protein [Prevotella sp.]MCI2087956.1 hypothetical protein [Prevotella sp.]MCI2125388.1 hypothetical protein [Prevotella sp.]